MILINFTLKRANETEMLIHAQNNPLPNYYKLISFHSELNCCVKVKGFIVFCSVSLHNVIKIDDNYWTIDTHI